MTTRQQIELYLKDLPSKWKDQLTDLLCQIKEDKQTVDCDKVRECETVTTLSDFSVEQTTANITYTDEDGVTYVRRFNVALALNNLMNELDPSCIMSEEDWLDASYLVKFQAIIDSHCDCCS